MVYIYAYPSLLQRKMIPLRSLTIAIAHRLFHLSSLEFHQLENCSQCTKTASNRSGVKYFLCNRKMLTAIEEQDRGDRSMNLTSCSIL